VLKTLLLLGAAGSVGALSRFALAGMMQNWCGVHFPWGTLAVNSLGCFLFGLVWPLGEEHVVMTGQARFILLTGFMGSFTTFSTYAFDASRYIEAGRWPQATAILGLHNVLGLCGMFAGLAVGRWLTAAA
jgi:fluoride exporter